MPTWIERLLPPSPLVMVAGIGIHPAARAAERHLATRASEAADQPA